MPSFTVTISDKTQPAQSIYTLATKGSQTGYTVNPPTPPAIKAVTEIQDVSFLQIQASKTNGSGIVYKGDQGVANDGSRQSREMAAGDVDTMQAYPRVVYLQEIYLRTNTNGAIINVEYHHS
jgi:hypothetical protein